MALTGVRAEDFEEHKPEITGDIHSGPA